MATKAHDRHALDPTRCRKNTVIFVLSRLPLGTGYPSALYQLTF